MPSANYQSHILIIEDDKGRLEVVLDEPMYSIGRDPKCDIRLVSQFVSRRHATLVQFPNEDSSFSYRIVDGVPQGKASSSGLLINGKKLKAHDLQHEDRVVFGSNVSATYLVLGRDEVISADEFDSDDDDPSGGIAPVPRPWKPTPPPLTDEDAISLDDI